MKDFATFTIGSHHSPTSSHLRYLSTGSGTFYGKFWSASSNSNNLSITTLARPFQVHTLLHTRNTQPSHNISPPQTSRINQHGRIQHSDITHLRQTDTRIDTIYNMNQRLHIN